MPVPSSDTEADVVPGIVEPANSSKPGASEPEKITSPVRLLKVDLCRTSTLQMQSPQRLPWVVFMGLHKLTSGMIVMTLAGTIDSTWLLTEAPKSWQERMCLKDPDCQMLSLICKSS